MNVLISFLGTTLDRKGGFTPGRWEIWRPSVAIAMHSELHFDKYYLLYQPKFASLKDHIAEDIQSVSPRTEIIPVELDMKDPWDFEEVYDTLYNFSYQYNFAAEEADFYIHITTGTHVAQICLFLLTESHHLPGKLIQTQPDDAQKTLGKYNVIDLDLSRYDLLAQRFAVEREHDVNFLKSGIPTRNKKFNALIETIERVAIRSSDPILLSGPTGAGKSKLARQIYELKKLNGQLKGPFVSVNCATLRGDQAMSVLFGHKKGAFTGAVTERSGLLNTADKGILFLDEIGELGLDEQAMLLHAIEEKRFFPLGADTETESSFELICGTNRDLEEECASGNFRADLLARINLWNFELPGLADRREDIEPNLEYELDCFTQKSGKRITFNAEARKAFMKYALSPSTPWKGNFRDLNAAVTRMATLSSGGRIDLECVNAEISRTKKRSSLSVAGSFQLQELLGEDFAERYDYFDLVQLEKVIEVCRNSSSRAEAGKKLFAVSRQKKKSFNDSDRLGKYLEKFGLDFAKISKHS